MAVWFGVGFPNPPSQFLTRLEKMGKNERKVAEAQLAQLIVIRVFRMMYSKLTFAQRNEFISLITSNPTPQQILAIFEPAIPDIKTVIHEAVQNVFRDIAV
jgi:hypothetical protein